MAWARHMDGWKHARSCQKRLCRISSKALHHRSLQKAMAKDRCNVPSVRLPAAGGHVLVADGQLHWCAICGARGKLHSIGNQRCGGSKKDKWAKKAHTLADLQHHSHGHQRMASGDVIWCNICCTYGTYRGCGLARPCPGPPRMGAGGGMWQRLRLLRHNKHPKEGNSLPEAIPEVRWSMLTISNVNTAMDESRTRDKIRALKVALSSSGGSTALPVSKLEQVKLRVMAKQHSAESRLAQSSTRNPCTGISPSSSMSRFEALRQRIKQKEMSATGELHEPE